jgi:hypothetical protein
MVNQIYGVSRCRFLLGRAAPLNARTAKDLAELATAVRGYGSSG